jgi:hypothetical protein
MVSAIRIYVEGGGDPVSKTKLRKAFNRFLDELQKIASRNRIKWDIIACGSRDTAYDHFRTALGEYPTAFNVLLVDSEKPVASGVGLWQHLKDRDSWNCPAGVDESQCFLMVQSMETWLIADLESLQEFYGQGFLPNAIPRQADIESIDKVRLMDALSRATINTRSKGEYHKTKHGFDLLGRANPRMVRQRSFHCNRLFTTLAEKMGEEIAG